MRGIDVSEHNGTLDWGKIKAAGIEFAILRGGYGRYQVDGQFRANLKGAMAQNIPIGVYWFSYAVSQDMARQEAKKCLETLGDTALQLPVFYDFEYDSLRYAREQGVTVTSRDFNRFARAFLEEIQAGGYRPGIYYNLDYYRTMVDTAQLAGYGVWYAQFASSPSISDYDIWQYSSSGEIPGLSGRFDMNELKSTSLLQTQEKTGWQKNDTGWWYVLPDGSYPAGGWEQIDGKSYLFNDKGYWVEYPQETRYHLLGDVKEPMYRETLNRLIARDVLRGREGSGESLVLDLGEDAIRMLVTLERAGALGE